MILEFTFTPEEMRAAGERYGLRAALSNGLLGAHIAPLAAFALGMLFVVILAFTALIPKRAAEYALILGAAAYMVQRLFLRRRMFAARKRGLAWGGALGGPVRLSLEGLALNGAEIDASELVFVWPREGVPVVWPARADPSGAFLAAVMARTQM